MKKLLSKIKKHLGLIAASAISCVALSVGAFAASTESPSALEGASDQILNQFQSAASDITPIILGILGAGLGIFVIFVGIKLGKKMFKTVSNG